ncbi:MAG: hypothetical protein QOH67_3420, partial [Hyphomicrobiales bacterium]|nr:hypothetical protein [Hyphomicrobiales bacterium]
AAVMVAFLMYSFVAGIPVDPQRRLIFNVLVAFSVAASGAFLGGDAVAKGSIPFFGKSPLTFTVTSGIAIFLIVLAAMSHAS